MNKKIRDSGVWKLSKELAVVVLRDTKYASRDTSSGQALVEFTVALVVIMAVVVGSILLGRIEQAHTYTMLAARAEAGALAMAADLLHSLDARFIADWQPAADNIRYTHDDEPIVDGNIEFLFDDILTNAHVTVSNKLYFLVKGSDSAAIDLSAIPAANRLFSGQPTLSVESEAWLAWTEGIYEYDKFKINIE